MKRSSPQAWTSLGLDAWALGLEASAVIGLRTMKLAMGGAGTGAEAQLMVSEKVKAALELQTALMTGKISADPVQAGRAIVAHYTRKTRANRRRLSKTVA